MTLQVRAVVNTPWARKDEIFEVEELSDNQRWHAEHGNLVVLDVAGTEEEKAETEAEAVANEAQVAEQTVLSETVGKPADDTQQAAQTNEESAADPAPEDSEPEAVDPAPEDSAPEE